MRLMVPSKNENNQVLLSKLKISTVMKSQHLLTIIWLIAAMMVPTTAQAYDFEAGGIYYNTTSDNTVSVTYKDNTFNSYSGTVNIPATVTNGGVSYNVTAIGSSAFRSCPDLTTVNIASGVLSIGYASFYMCTGLTSVSIPNTVTYINTFAFRNCSSLVEITLPNSVTTLMGQVFQNCTSLQQVTLPEDITEINAGLFWGCSSLQSIVIPSKVVYIGMYAFANCYNLTDITFADATLDISSDAFDGTPWLENQPDGVIYAGKAAFSYKGLMEDGTHLTLRPGTVSICARALYGLDALYGITIPASVKHVSANCLGNCYNLATIIVENGNTTYDSRYDCNAIIETGTNTLVCGCKGTVIPTSVTAIADFAFYQCQGLAYAQLHEGITAIGDYAFEQCIGLRSITIPASVNSIGNSAFASCYNISSIKVASSNTTYDSRNDCNAIIETATNKLIAGCCTTVIPNGVATIGAYAFYGHFRLQHIRIPATVTQIEDYALSYTPYLQTMICEATTPPTATGTSFYDNTYENCVLYVPRTSIAAYQNAEQWSSFVDIRALEDLKIGDVDGNNQVNISDVILLINMLTAPDYHYDYRSDMNGDGTINITDVIALINVILNEG